MMMNEIFQDLITEGIISVYLNDILIFTDSLEEHRWITRLVLDCMHEHKLYLWLEKCEFEQTRIEYLGIIISHNNRSGEDCRSSRLANAFKQKGGAILRQLCQFLLTLHPWVLPPCAHTI
jgi:hypothetical protein